MSDSAKKVENVGLHHSEKESDGPELFIMDCSADSSEAGNAVGDGSTNLQSLRGKVAIVLVVVVTWYLWARCW